jgi:tetratricopeptide (TPR) repeat protein
VLRTQEGKSEEVKRDLWKAYELDPGNPAVIGTLGLTLIKDGKYNDGAAMLIKSINIGLTKKDTDYYIRWGNIYEMVGDFKNAEKLFIQCRNLAPGWSEVYAHLGLLYREWGKYQKSIQMFSEGLKIVPEDPTFIDNLAWVYFNMGELDSASHYWSQYEALERNFMDRSQYIPFRHRYAYTLFKLGREEAAHALFEEQIRLDMEQQQGLRGYGAWSEGSYYYDLGIVNAFLGNTEEAIIWLDSAATKGYFAVSFVKTDPLLDGIRTDKRFQALVSKKEQEYTMLVNAVKEEMKKHKNDLPL